MRGVNINILNMKLTNMSQNISLLTLFPSSWPCNPRPGGGRGVHVLQAVSHHLQLPHTREVVYSQHLNSNDGHQVETGQDEKSYEGLEEVESSVGGV